jgi:hypothetical protein
MRGGRPRRWQLECKRRRGKHHCGAVAEASVPSVNRWLPPRPSTPRVCHRRALGLSKATLVRLSRAARHHMKSVSGVPNARSEKSSSWPSPATSSRSSFARANRARSNPGSVARQERSEQTIGTRRNTDGYRRDPKLLHHLPAPTQMQTRSASGRTFRRKVSNASSVASLPNWPQPNRPRSQFLSARSACRPH